MRFDLYNRLRTDPGYNRLVGKDYLIVEYKCPIETLQFQLLTECHFIIYVISGRKDWMTSGKTYEVKASDALFVRRGVYTTRQYLDVDHCILLFFISDAFIRNFMRENTSLRVANNGQSIDDQIFVLDVDDPLKSLFSSVFNYLRLDTGIPTNLVELKFKELLFNIVMNPRHRQIARFFTSLSQHDQTDLDEVMMKNFHHDLALEEYARLCGRSLSSFKRDFKELYQQSPGKWLTEKRLEYARALLLSTDLHVNEVGYESGFRNSSHFNKAFKDKYRLPPGQFRLTGKTA